MYGPPIGKKCLLFVDDLHLPQPDSQGAFPPLELVRQLLDHRTWYGVKKEVTTLKLEDIQVTVETWFYFTSARISFDVDILIPKSPFFIHAFDIQIPRSSFFLHAFDILTSRSPFSPQLVSAMTLSEIERLNLSPRLLGHFTVIAINSFSDDMIKSIYSQVPISSW